MTIRTIRTIRTTRTASTGPSSVVASADGTPIAVTISGRGRPLVLVPGTSADHTSWRLVQPHLEPRSSVHAVDRRGRGASGDDADYQVEQEFADIAAVVDAAAALDGGPVDLVGHSYGGMICFGAAGLTHNVRRLVLYEGWPLVDPARRTVDPVVLARVDRLLAEGRRAEMLAVFFREIVQMNEDELRALQEAPTWRARVNAAHTVPRELRTFDGQLLHPETAARVEVPVLLLVGEKSPDDIRADPDAVAAALPNARIQLLPGQTHVANTSAPRMLGEAVSAFLHA